MVRRQNDAKALLQFAEDEFAQNVFWFDLQRLAAESLKSLGDNHSEAAEAIRSEVSAFIRRHPGIEKLSFSNGQSFADEQTHKWLSELQGGTFVPQPIEMDVTPEADPSKPMAEIKKLLRGKKISEAARRFQSTLRTLPSGREKFQFKVEFAQLLSKTTHDELLAVQVEQIMEDIEQYRLDDFEPALALRGLSVALNHYRGESDELSQKKAKETLYRMSKIDMGQLIRFEEAS
jgi:type VI secretion system protein VasJ